MDDDVRGLARPAASDWWQASNDLWYPPDAHPDAAPKPPPPQPRQPAPPSAPGSSGWQPGAAPPPQQPGYAPYPGPGPQAGGPMPPAAPPKRKGLSTGMKVLAVVGAFFVLALGGCAVAGVWATVQVGSAIDEATDNIDALDDVGGIGELLEEEGGIGELLDEEGPIGDLLDEEGGVGGLLDEAAQFGVCLQTIEQIENQGADDQLDLLDQAIEKCGTISILELALLEQTQLLDGQTVRELVEERCAAPDTNLSSTRICMEIDEPG